MAVAGVNLPPLRQHQSPNVSARLHGIVPYLVVLHRPVGSFAGSEATLTSPAAQVSAHILTDSDREAVQLVPWDRKAWACASFNSVSYNLEIDDAAWTGKDQAGWDTAARITAYLCTRTGIPPTWTHDPARVPGIIRHYDLGLAGGGHTDPTTDPAVWRRFAARVQVEHARGGFRPSWGEGTLHRIDV
jgi:N-acetyl-anhydromuramyl-L-alanine amidase AmpD